MSGVIILLVMALIFLIMSIFLVNANIKVSHLGIKRS